MKVNICACLRNAETQWLQLVQQVPTRTLQHDWCCVSFVIASLTKGMPGRFVADFTNPKAVEWWQAGLREALFATGIDSVWNGEASLARTLVTVMDKPWQNNSGVRQVVLQPLNLLAKAITLSPGL